MYPFIESIRYENGQAYNLQLHQQRVDATFDHYYKDSAPISLADIIAAHPHAEEGLYKLRILYNRELLEIEYQPYHHPQFTEYALIDIPDDYSYRFKSTDRQLFNHIGQQYPPHVLPLLVQQGRITDSTYTNLIFTQQGRWYSPNTPLLMGTMLQSLINEGRVQLTEIRAEDINQYDSIIPINAINRPGEAGEVEI